MALFCLNLVTIARCPAKSRPSDPSAAPRWRLRSCDPPVADSKSRAAGYTNRKTRSSVEIQSRHVHEVKTCGKSIPGWRLASSHPQLRLMPCMSCSTSSRSSRKRVPAASWSSVWYLLSAFAVISYTRNWVYVCFAALGSWIGAYLSMTLLGKPRSDSRDPDTVARKPGLVARTKAITTSRSIMSGLAVRVKGRRFEPRKSGE